MRLTRRGALGAGLSAGLLAGPLAHATDAAPEVFPLWSLWYRQPATRWVEALPIGTGRLGAMLYGGIGEERIQLNEGSFWAGGPYDPARPEAKAALEQVRALIWQGRHAEAQALADRDLMARPLQQMPYQTLGELRIALDGQARPDDYRRWLDLDAATVTSRWQAGGARYTRESYASAADQVLVHSIVSEGGVPLSARIALSRAARVEGDTLWAEGNNREARGVAGALRFALGVRVIAEGGRIEVEGEAVRVTGASRITLLIAARTSYRDWRHTDGDALGAARRDLDGAAARGLAALRSRHLAGHRRLFRGFDLDLGADPAPGTPTDERVRYSHDGRGDPHLAALYVQYSRYLLISCSRPGSQPANLQGLWNDSDTPPWDSKYTININTQMNYWPAEPMGLGECVEPLIAMIEDLAESGARTATTMYGARGWVAHHNTDLWRASAPIDGAFWGLWPTGGAWLCKHLWDRWDYSRDPALLERIYPLMRGAALFFLDTLVEHPDGSGLVTSPSISPENAHHPGVSICAGPAMDRQILRELFANTAECAALLKRDPTLQAQMRAAAASLPADRIGKAGQLQEWLEDWDMDVPEIQHRHVSHLYAVHPGHAIHRDTPELLRAAARSLEIRGDDATGWGLGWRINLWARLGNGARAHLVLRKLLGPDRTYPNLFDAHPPFQIDGNFGGAAGVIEMLVHDQPQRTEWLPALPDAWPSGSVTGLRLRGGITADLVWRDKGLAGLTLTASHPVERTFAYGGKLVTCKLRPGTPLRLGPDLQPETA
ncbi:glycoside hydrolase family 95 protein [Sphingomonas soli]|uniref:glycoside hydrolase family 95 protein n=1 Tax=Sphingomonas soli TaxID=266127 RepID=UPI000A0716AC|nr:glycoside hydrolase family 95 protein [Sphingomonas soli]